MGLTSPPSVAISIHAPRTGSDRNKMTTLTRDEVISIHAPRTGSDHDCYSTGLIAPEFQSTLPARGATFLHVAEKQQIFISIHAPRTGSDVCDNISFCRYDISIHAPRTGSDDMSMTQIIALRISIHAPRTGSDQAIREKV